MQEHAIINSALASILAPFINGWQTLCIWLILSLVLIFGDLRFGISAAKKRGEKIRSSRALRRTINKFVDYMCWVSIACVMGTAFGDAFGVPLLAVIIMAVICAIELSSIFDNYCEYKGMKKHFNVFKFLARLFHRPEIEDCFDDKPEEQK